MMTSSTSVNAQQPFYAFEHYHHAHGLPAPVTKIVRDSFGFIWAGTMDGLHRFDGRTFEKHRHDPGDPTTLSNNIINDLCVDADNRIWAATNGGLCYFDQVVSVFSRIPFHATLERIDRHRVHAVCPAAEGGVWLATKTMIHHWQEGAEISSYSLPASDDLSIKCLFADPHHRVWCGTSQGVFVWHPDQHLFLHTPITSKFSTEQNLSVTVHPIIPYSGDTMLVGSWYGGVQKVFLSGQELRHIPIVDHIETDPRKHVIRSIYPGKNSTWWVASYGNGISLWESSSNTFVRHVHHDPSVPHSLSDDYVNDILLDPSGILWVGTNKGLDKYDPLTQQFMSIEIPGTNTGFSVYRLPSSITADRRDPQQLWITVPGAGLYQYNIRDQTFRLRQHAPGNPHSLPDNSIHTTYFDDYDRMWLGTRKGLFLYDRDADRFYPAPLPSGVDLPGVHTLFQDQHRSFWFATHSHGIARYNPNTGEFKRYTYDPVVSGGLPDQRVFCLIEDRKGQIWIGTQNRGLCRLDPENGAFTYFHHTPDKPGSIPDNGVFDLYEDDHDQLWIATENGLAVMSLRDFSIQTYTTKDGLCSNHIFSILPDDDGQLWLATNNGLSKMDPARKRFKNFYISDGLPTNTFSGPLYFSTKGTLYFGTTGILNICHPDRMTFNTVAPEVIITHVRIFDKPKQLIRRGAQIQPIKLLYRENMITLEFTALDYSNPTLHQYAYRLDGFDTDWMYCGNTQSATYTNLDGGSYVFRVKAANKDGLWNDIGAHLHVKIRPPFHKTWWFYMLVLLMALGGLYGLFRIRVAQLLRLQQMRLRISRDLHDDIGSTLSSIHMMSRMATQTTPEEKKSSDILATIASASRQAMEHMSDIVWSINPKNDRMDMVLSRMRHYASEILEAAEIDFTIEMEESCQSIIMPVEKRKDVYLIYKEAVNNLAKYAQATRAEIRLALIQRRFVLTVQDNGIGFDPEKIKSGNGLKNMSARAEQLGGILQIISTPGHGTQIQLSVPVTP